MTLSSLNSLRSTISIAALRGHSTLHGGLLAASTGSSGGGNFFTNLFTSPTNIFAPQSVPAHEIFRLSIFVLIITGAILATVWGLLIHVIIRYRRRPGDDEHEPPQIYGSNQIELAWTVIPILIVVVLFLSTVRIIFSLQNAKPPKQALDVTVTGHQWWWEFTYPKYNFVTANELHVPVSNDAKHPMPTFMKLVTADVDHSFWVPRLAGKTDLMAGQVNNMWIQPEATGLYLGQCAQYCGKEHAHMLIRVYAQTPADFEKWVANQEKNAVNDPAVAAGRAVFEHNACINCHTIRGTVADGRFGPDLTHLMSRDTIASGILPNTKQNLESWIKDPDLYKPGCLMPAMKLSDQDIASIASYLVTLK
ncbi:MAG: cytochrome c oxidase subunit II [Acidobacteriaceae bacterium]